jgi:hypothetical protein
MDSKTINNFDAIWNKEELSVLKIDKYNWMTDDRGMDEIEKRLFKLKTHKVLTQSMIRYLSPVDDRTYNAGMLGANPAGMYYPSKEK